MQQVRLGSSGLHVSRVCLGMMSYGSSAWRPWVLDEDRAAPIVRAAVEAGITFFDTADGYSDGQSEVVTGRLLQPLLSRDELVIATKVFTPMTPGPNGRGLSRKHILAGIDASLARLGMDYVDLYQIHRFDPLTPVEETMQALHDVVRAGKARYIGASSMFAWQFAKLQHAAERHGWTRFVSMQNHYNLAVPRGGAGDDPALPRPGRGHRSVEPARARSARGHARPHRRAPGRARGDRHLPGRAVRTARGLRRDRPGRRGGRRPRRRRRRRSRSRGCSHKPAVVPIVGATREGHIADARAATELGLSDEEIASLETPYVANAVRGHDRDARPWSRDTSELICFHIRCSKASPAGAGLLYWALRLMNPLKGGRA